MHIQKTEDYNLFKRIKGNRTINKSQVGKLYASFNDNPDIASAIPIVVNDKNEIIDGQHRFEALKKLGLPIYYVQASGLSLEDVQIINSATKTWNPVDYAKSFSELGKQDYAIYLDFKKEYHFAHAVLLLMLTGQNSNGGGTTVNTFRKGQFEVTDVALAKKLSDQLTEIKQFYSRGDTRVFAVAFKKVALSPKYDHKRMMEKMAANNKFLKDSPYAEDYVRQLEKIYNHHMGVENRVRLF